MKHGLSILLLAVAAALALPRLGAAHHAFAAEFDANKPLTLTGTVTRIEWSNPHAWFYIDVSDGDGPVASCRNSPLAYCKPKRRADVRHCAAALQDRPDTGADPAAARGERGFPSGVHGRPRTG